MMTNLEIVKGAYKGFSEGNMEVLFSNLADDVVWKNHSFSESPLPEVSNGVEGVMHYFGAVEKGMEIQKFDIQNILQDGDLFTVLIDVKRKLVADGSENGGQYVHVIKFENGKLKAFDAYEAKA